nr:ORF2 [Red fox Torque teno virus 1]
MPVIPEKSVTWSDLQDKKRRQEALWLQSCSQSHSAWCDCGSWTSHIRTIIPSPKPCATEASTEDGTTNGDAEKEVLVSFDVGSPAADGG